ISRTARCSVEPVPADSVVSCGAVGDGVEASAARVDYSRGADVVVIAVHQHPVNSDGAGDDQALPEDLGCVAAPPVRGKYAVADVPAFSFQELVKCVADGRPGDDLSGGIG